MLKKNVLILLFSLIAFFSLAQREKGEKYIALYKDAAIKEMRRSGVPAAITLAQGMLESGYGESELCKKSNNHFGIKCKENWTGERTYADDDEKGECFRVYPNAYESYKDHSDFLRSREWYNSLFKLEPTDYEGWAYGLKKAGYATEKKYPQMLINLINDYNLQQYSLQGMKKEEVVTETAIDTTAKVDDEKEEPKEPIDSETVVNPVKPLVKKDSSSANSTTYPKGVFTINHAQVIFAKEGTSLLALAEMYKISLRNLIAYNDMEEMDLLDKDRLLFIEKKLKKGAKDFYEAKGNETLYDVSQTEGLQLESLTQYNKLYKNAVLKKGDKIYLRPQSKK